MATFKIVNQISNITVQPSNLTGLVCGQPITITLTANSGYYFGKAPVVNFSDGFGGYADYTFTTEQSSTPTVYTLALTAEQTTQLDGFDGYIRGGDVTQATTFSVTNNIANTSTIPTDLSSFMTGTEVTITITANDGYYFTTAPYMESSDGMGALNNYNFSTSEMSFPKIYTLTLSSDQTREPPAGTCRRQAGSGAACV